MKYLVIIPARGGSKGIPRKNIKVLKDKPLIEYTLNAARNVFQDDFICVSTDDVEIKEFVENCGINVPFLRPKELATDVASSYMVIDHALTFYQKQKKNSPDAIVLLQPTSPFRNANHIKEALKLYSNEVDMVLSVKESKSNPYFNLYEQNEEGYLEKSKSNTFTRRQDCPSVWEANGAIYIINAQSLQLEKKIPSNKIIKYTMSEIDSHDLDTTTDWELAEYYLESSDFLNL